MYFLEDIFGSGEPLQFLPRTLDDQENFSTGCTISGAPASGQRWHRISAIIDIMMMDGMSLY